MFLFNYLFLSLYTDNTNDTIFMKKKWGILIGMLFLLLVSTICYSQEQKPTINKENVSGRWTEVKRIEGDTSYDAGDYPDTYIFRDNMVFHKGESSEGVILFNITGRYTIEGDSVVIFYRDYTEANASKREAKKLIFDILSLSKDEMFVLVSDYDYSYKLLLKK